MGLLCGSDSKESACNVGDLGLIPGSGRSPGEGNGYPLQCSSLKNSMDRGAWRTTYGPQGCKELDTIEWLIHPHILDSETVFRLLFQNSITILYIAMFTEFPLWNSKRVKLFIHILIQIFKSVTEAETKVYFFLSYWKNYKIILKILNYYCVFE